ncbi:MAG: septal ring lytic transglycosylase RlpA family lipoprotein [Candidatus Komeilibacteria bacterium CG_4_10_14_0_2_um_filter_37_10]|uniref:Septal ring lytic transglycosylase RlpA family lipoprotein n=1 Tax=Candidatus Komeilibacteria bacterium CG_4_10_14_0_2_um_filter_37_10 TaxID=1974470 RepID=A0A2M7VGV3_9BACT|nr:MAG: septal ring lytic transglycosylase RlpA family lipoprotein [Candidatus Komeilibacteria bacterium CG_4_10_14_0_2_um_filter_37_10]
MPLLYFLNDQQQWQMLDSKIDLKKELIIATTEQPELFILVAYQPDSWLGRATWYHYRKCLCAASRDYPKGTKLKVTNINNNKSVIVKINDYGPEKWTKNLIDLDAVAFKKISSLRAGVINVKIEKIP